MSALEDQFFDYGKPSSFNRARTEFSDVEEWERDQERYWKSKRSKRYRADLLIQNLDASSKFKAALICAAGMSVIRL